eukprot:TRINITY_DN7486_c0_g1_i2.p1 TRINITY_DN7486_c0_g1~~TRINITY_DN7486_c0_g1_i2.p1  ORF type:complete len:212 (-),score=39.40 TRINITY_DN7486_c0_g1_i2:246-881(-)
MKEKEEREEEESERRRQSAQLGGWIFPLGALIFFCQSSSSSQAILHNELGLKFSVLMAEQGTSYLNAGSSMPPKKRMVITLNAHGLPVGDNSTKFSSRCGQLVRSIVPISYKDWRAVPNEKKDELWKLLLLYKDKCLRSMAESMRKYKTKLRMQYLNSHKTQEEKLNNRPPGVRPEDWEVFIKHNADPKTIEQREKKYRDQEENENLSYEW